MGMSDKQFESYKSQLLMNLQTAKEDIQKDNNISKLEKIIDNLESELKKP